MAHRSIPTAQAAPTAFAYGLHSLPPQPKRQGMQAQPPWHYLPKQQPQWLRQTRKAIFQTTPPADSAPATHKGTPRQGGANRHRPPRLPTQGYRREAVVPHGQCHGAHRKRMAPGSNQMARIAAKRHSRCQHLPRKRHPPHAAIAAQLRPMQQKPTWRHPGNGHRRHSWQGRRHVKKARRNQCQRKAGTIAPAKKTYNHKPPSHCRRRITAVRHSKTAHIDMRNMPFCSLKRHVSEGSNPNAATPCQPIG